MERSAPRLYLMADPASRFHCRWNFLPHLRCVMVTAVNDSPARVNQSTTIG